MVSLVDIVPQTKIAQVAGSDVELRGLALKQIGDLLVRFPELRKFLVEGGPAVNVDVLFSAMPDTCSAIIAAAARRPELEETIAAEVPIGEVFEMLEEVWGLTFPKGLPPFLAMIIGANRANGVDHSGREADMNGPPPPSN